MEKLKKYQDYFNLSEELKYELSQKQLFTNLFEIYEGNLKGYTRIKFRQRLDTPKVLFRLFYLFQNLSKMIGEKIQINDSYNHLFVLSANNKNILVHFYIYKYEIRIGYYAKKEFVIDDMIGCFTENEEKKNRDKILNNDKNFSYEALATDEIMNYIDVIDNGFVNTSYIIYDGNNFVV